MSDFRRIHFWKKRKIEGQIRAQIRKDAEIPDQVYKSAGEAYRMIREGTVHQEPLERRKANAEHLSKCLPPTCRRAEGERALHCKRRKANAEHLSKCLPPTCRRTEGEGALHLLPRLAYTMAAVLLVCVIANAAFPVQVRALPIVGSIFEQIQKAVGYENLSEYARPLTGGEEDAEDHTGSRESNAENGTDTKGSKESNAENGTDAKGNKKSEAENGTDAEDSKESNAESGTDAEKRTGSDAQAYTQTSGDVTVSVSEVYADSEVIYLSMMFENREPFPKSFYYSSENEKIDGKVAMVLYANKKYSFMKNVDMEFWCGRNIEAVVEGLMVNENTYEFLWRIELASDLGQYRRNVDKDAALPEAFTMDLEIDSISSLLSMEKSYRGPWNFRIPIQVDESRRETVEVHETSGTGAGLVSVEKTPFEITTRAITPGRTGYKVVVLDAEGNKLPNVLQNEIWSDEAADEMREKWRIEGHDVSSVEVFVLGKDFYENVYATGLWGRTDWEGNENKPKEKKLGTLLTHYAEYHKIIRFEEKGKCEALKKCPFLRQCHKESSRNAGPSL